LNLIKINAFSIKKRPLAANPTKNSNRLILDLKSIQFVNDERM